MSIAAKCKLSPNSSVVTSLRNDLAKQKINLGADDRLPPNDQYDLSDDVPYSAAPPITMEEAFRQAFEQRPDLKAAASQVRAAELARSGARSERLPSLAVNADYGVIGTNPPNLTVRSRSLGHCAFPSGRVADGRRYRASRRHLNAKTRRTRRSQTASRGRHPKSLSRLRGGNQRGGGGAD